ncbi:ECF-type sigma factor [Lysobacter sp.]|uniref:ECF-type sigma factor n=1 Tax=Lysobacter sp. TaxID=72226 RepID=UPI002D47E2B5|nr:ECF-type sigma factor [Lysobacter sp.]HZX78843.1 ECF-type sigma factor [Lysobacter sp.]
MSQEITRLLRSWSGGDQEALGPLFELVYETLHEIAVARLRSNAQHTLQPTSLINEAVLRLMGRNVEWNDRAHFFAVAALKMRAVLVDYARAMASAKRGGDVELLTLSHAEHEGVAVEFDVLELHRTLEKLAEMDSRSARVIEMAYFGGMDREEIAAVIGVSVPTVDRDLRFAKAWLNRELA